MDDTHSHCDGELLAREIARYLAVVDLFREVGCPPAWRAEPAAERLAAVDDFHEVPGSYS